jgi:hypothetical protein
MVRMSIRFRCASAPLRAILPLILFGFLWVGCGPSGQVKVYPVKGRVNFEGKPMMGGGSISFVPLTDQAGKAAGGVIKPDGTYEVGTYAEADGSMAGEFKVTVFQETAQEQVATPDGTAPAAASKPDVPQADRIPLVYMSDRETPLRATVEAKPANEINFELKRQP